MRIHEGDYAYEIEEALDPETRARTGWRFNIYRVRPQDRLLRSEIAPTKEAAETAGKQGLAELLNAEGRGSDRSQKSAA